MSHQYYKPARYRLQRSELAVPGSSPKMFEKALNSNADYILEQRKEYRVSVRKRNTYAEVLNVLQADIMKKLYKNKLKIKNKKLLTDAMLVTIAGIAAAMKNVG